MNSQDPSRADWQASIGNDSGILDKKKISAENAVSKHAPSLTGWQDKFVLLVDVNSRTRETRSKMLRKFGVTVHCVPSTGAARARMAATNYNLVLIDLGNKIEEAESFAQELRARNKHQRLGFLIGSPLYIATSLKGRALAQPLTAAPAQTPAVKTAASGLSDFGQKIKDAEAEQATL